jgi:acyl carrier protein
VSADILPRVANLINGYTGVLAETITQDTDFDAIGFDSLDRVELAMLVEDEFHIELPRDAEGDWKTVGDITGWLETTMVSGRG